MNREILVNPGEHHRCCATCVEFVPQSSGHGCCFIEEERLIDGWMEMDEKPRIGEEDDRIPGLRKPSFITHPGWQCCPMYKENPKMEGRKMDETTLEDTIKMMGGDWQDRFRAEYWQTRIREERLGKMLDKWQDGELDFTPNCPFEILAHQHTLMRKYVRILEMRAEIEGIDLDDRQVYL